MLEDQFWDIIEESRIGISDSDQQADKLVEILKQFPPKGSLKFREILAVKLHESYSWDVWGVAYIVNTGCSDDGFEYFRCWLIGQGKAVFEKALRDAESITEITDPEQEYYNEQLLYAPMYAYEALTGQEMPPFEGWYWYGGEPKGEPWEVDDLPRRFPRACEKYGWD
jgi:hypothetical protein